jgi:hypothetical protein
MVTSEQAAEQVVVVTATVLAMIEDVENRLNTGLPISSQELEALLHEIYSAERRTLH